MNPNQVYYSSTGRGPGRGRRILVVVGLFVLIAAAIAFFLYTGRSKNADDNNNGKTSQNKDAGVVLSLSVAKNPTFVAPKKMEGYTKQSNFTADVGDYTTNDNGCNIQYGVVSATELPGTTPQIIAINHLGAGSDSGAIGGDPKDASDLVLKSAVGSQRYSMPTFKFDFSRDGVNYLAQYSIVILPGDNRAYVRTYCANTGEAVSKTAFNRVNSKAKEITIQTQ